MMVLAVMACIFYLSSQPATDSRALSNKVLEVLRSCFHRAASLAPFIQKLNVGYPVVRIRKVAHFTIYLVLGLVSYLVLPRKWPIWRRLTCVIALCFVYAITDEIHQHFVAGRNPEVRDVLIDTLGSSVGMSIGCVVRRFK